MYIIYNDVVWSLTSVLMSLSCWKYKPLHYRWDEDYEPTLMVSPQWLIMLFNFISEDRSRFLRFVTGRSRLPAPIYVFPDKQGWVQVHPQKYITDKLLFVIDSEIAYLENFKWNMMLFMSLFPVLALKQLMHFLSPPHVPALFIYPTTQGTLTLCVYICRICYCIYI